MVVGKGSSISQRQGLSPVLPNVKVCLLPALTCIDRQGDTFASHAQEGSVGGWIEFRFSPNRTEVQKFPPFSGVLQQALVKAWTLALALAHALQDPWRAKHGEGRGILYARCTA